jgi:hypothetical protein
MLPHEQESCCWRAEKTPGWKEVPLVHCVAFCKLLLLVTTTEEVC